MIGRVASSRFSKSARRSGEGVAPRRRYSGGAHRWAQVLGTYGLLVVLIGVIVGFSIARPSSFPTLFNLRSILNQQSVVVLLALAVMVPLASGEFDLSVGYLIGLAEILAVGFQVRSGMNWAVAMAAVLAIGLALGLVSGVLVTRFGIDSFITSLAMGTMLYGVSLWYTGGQQLSGNLGHGFNVLSGNVVGVPVSAVVALGAAIVLWILFEFLPVGRYLYVLGANRRAALLSGISARRYVPLAFAASGLLTCVAGLLLAAQLQVGQATIGPDYLLPAFAGALLGATAVRPGRVNPWGTVIAVALLASVVSGIEQLGAQSYVQPLFNGGILIIAVGLAVYARRERVGGRLREISEGQSGTAADKGLAEGDSVGG